MKLSILLSATLAASIAVTTAQAQKIAIIDSKYILDKIPEYKEADVKLAQMAKQWQRTIDSRQASLDQIRKNYEAEQYMLSDELKKKRELEISNTEIEIRNLQKRYFGYEGELFQQRKILVQPIQDKVYNAVQKFALSNNYDAIFDKSEGITVFYADPKLNKSDDILKILGIKR